ncbi:flagellar biosynthesis protein FlgL [Leisingera caerulea]|uniref:Flagellar biosynthesis protein FlgL n=2 Tax=Leisingera caerulea TaxID=506591 RepID=A0ABY5WWN6_LEICA|nr:flagellin [Leisingera caerulea]UWQ49756.1 flagellar biosynthesis protein FlgL [Leisingera caerulea]UWQ58480.1 flagellar biosynthesis protein FlgL [Leisingera caerulea]
MILNSYGDMAQHLFLRSRNTELKENVTTLSEEFATGKSANLTDRLGGDFTYLADLESSLNRIDSYMVANGEVQLFATATQGSLEKVNSQVQAMRNDILRLSPAVDVENAEQFGSQAKKRMSSAINLMNTSVGGRTIFAGTATDTKPLNDSGTLMTAILAEVSGLTTSNDIIQAVKDWFDDPAGFDAVMYRGSTTSLQPVTVGEGEQVTLGIRADDDNLKHTLQSYVITALADEPSLGLTDDVQIDLVIQASSELSESDDRLVDLQADVGFIEGQLEAVNTRNEASKTSLSIVKNNLVSADPYETYTRLQEAQTQLEGLYTITARSSQLSLLKYIS